MLFDFAVPCSGCRKSSSFLSPSLSSHLKSCPADGQLSGIAQHLLFLLLLCPALGEMGNPGIHKTNSSTREKPFQHYPTCSSQGKGAGMRWASNPIKPNTSLGFSDRPEGSTFHNRNPKFPKEPHLCFLKAQERGFLVNATPARRNIS